MKSVLYLDVLTFKSEKSEQVRIAHHMTVYIITVLGNS
jgi:hypothetical protein